MASSDDLLEAFENLLADDTPERHREFHKSILILLQAIELNLRMQNNILAKAHNVTIGTTSN